MRAARFAGWAAVAFASAAGRFGAVAPLAVELDGSGGDGAVARPLTVEFFRLVIDAPATRVAPAS